MRLVLQKKKNFSHWPRAVVHKVRATVLRAPVELVTTKSEQYQDALRAHALGVVRTTRYIVLGCESQEQAMEVVRSRFLVLDEWHEFIRKTRRVTKHVEVMPADVILYRETLA